MRFRNHGISTAPTHASTSRSSQQKSEPGDFDASISTAQKLAECFGILLAPTDVRRLDRSARRQEARSGCSGSNRFAQAAWTTRSKSRTLLRVPEDRGRGARTIVGFDPGVLGRMNEARPVVDPKRQFLERLQYALVERAVLVRVAAADLGREPQGLVWFLTLELHNGELLSLRTPVSNQTDPFSLSLADDIAQRIAAYLHGG
jgi:hypothetical protein